MESAIARESPAVSKAEARTIDARIRSLLRSAREARNRGRRGRAALVDARHGSAAARAELEALGLLLPGDAAPPPPAK